MASFLADSAGKRHLSSSVMYGAVLRCWPILLASQYALVLCWLLPAWTAGAEAPPRPGAVLCPSGFVWLHENDLPGTYQGHAPETDAARRVFTLDLAADGTASLTTLYIGKNDATERGRWTQSGSQIIVTFDAIGPNTPPHPITFRHHDHQLSPVHWDPSEWGRAGPPVLHRSRPRTTS